MQDVITLLIEQHRKLEALLATAEEAGESGDAAEQGAEILLEAADELAVHLLAEEEVFYPAVKAERTEDILLESLEEHLSLKRLVADLLVVSPAEQSFKPKVEVLKEQAEHHHREEEEHLFPKVRQLLGAERLAQLGAQVAEHQARLREAGGPRERLRAQTGAAAGLR